MSSDLNDPTGVNHYVAPATTTTLVVDAVRVDEKPSNLWSDAWRDLRRRPVFWLSLLVVAIVLLMAIWPTLFTQVPPNNDCQLADSNGGPTDGHPLGFTFLGCDVWARMVWGARTSLTVGLLATIIGTVIGLIMGAFAAMAVSAWYLIKGRHADFAMKTMRIGAVVGIVTSCVMIFTAHASAVVVAEEQPTKLAMMEGMYDDEVPPLYLFGWVDEESQQVITPFSIPGGTSFLATGTWDTEYQGLNSLAETEQYGALDPETAPVNFVFQTYHIMVAMYGLIMITAILAIVFTYRKGGRIKNMKWLQRLVLISPVFPVIAIQTGWFTAELGRQPWVVYPSATGPEGVALATGDAASASVSAPELLITMALFFLVYVFLIFAWARVMGRFIKEGPVVAPAEADDAASDEAKRKDAVPGFAPVDDPAVAAKGGE